MFSSDKMLIKGVDIIITLRRAPECFYLLHPSVENRVRITFSKLIFFITEVELEPLVAAHANVMDNKRKSLYLLTHSD